MYHITCDHRKLDQNTCMSTSEHILETTRPVTALKKSSFFFRATGRPQKGSGEETEGGGEGQKEGGEGERAKFGAG